MRNLGMEIAIAIFVMAMVFIIWNFLMRVYNDYRKDKARELEFLNRRDEYKKQTETKTKR